MKPMLAAVGPMSFPEHIGWLLLLSLFVFLVYNGLRVDSVPAAVRRGLHRWSLFLAAVAALAVVSGLLAQFL